MSAFQLYKRPRLGPLLMAGAVGVGAAAGIQYVGEGVGGAGTPTVSESDSVVGGDTASDELDGPVVRVSYRDVTDQEVLRCTGSTIGSDWVLTAAHCLKPTMDGDPLLRPVVGSRGVEYEVVETIVHPLYTPTFVDADPSVRGAHYDYALVRVDRPLATERVVLARSGDVGIWPAGTSVTIAGHGSTVDGGPVTGRLMSATVSTLTSSACSIWGEYVDERLHLCTSSMTAATCNGDSGGPVLIPEPSGGWMQLAVASFGDTECGSGVPDVHVRVDAVRAWIEEQVGHLDDPDLLSGEGGYWLATEAGQVIEFGDARFHGDLSVSSIDEPIVDIVVVPAGTGYLLIDASGGVHPFGETGFDAGRYAPADGDAIAAADVSPSGDGLWLFSETGAVVAIGDAWHLGDLAGIALRAPIVDAVATETGDGYWLVAADGGVFQFGDATFEGSLGGLSLNAPIVSMVPAPGGGYWMVAADGGMFAFGRAPFRGSVPGVLPRGGTLNAPIRGMAAYGDGYVLFGSDGGIFSFSDLDFRGSLGSAPPDRPVVAVGIAPTD